MVVELERGFERFDQARLDTRARNTELAAVSKAALGSGECLGGAAAGTEGMASTFGQPWRTRISFGVARRLVAGHDISGDRRARPCTVVATSRVSHTGRVVFAFVVLVLVGAGIAVGGAIYVDASFHDRPAVTLFSDVRVTGKPRPDVAALLRRRMNTALHGALGKNGLVPQFWKVECFEQGSRRLFCEGIVPRLHPPSQCYDWEAIASPGGWRVINLRNVGPPCSTNARRRALQLKSSGLSR